MSNYKFNIDIEPITNNASNNDNKSLSKSVNTQKTLKTSYLKDRILKFYICEIDIPKEEEWDYIKMLSCIEDILKDPDALKEPWSLLRHLNNMSKEYIPIKLVRWKDLPKVPQKGDKPTNDKIISPDILGAYRSWDAKEKKPIILLCPSKILKEANKLDMNAKLLCKKVIIHEFAHALMDPTNWDDSKGFVPPLQKIKPQKITSDASRFMEESLANMLTLKYFDELAKDEFNLVEDFIANHQPSIYRCGVNQFKLDTSWEKWRDYKANKTPDFWSYWAGLFADKKIK